MAQHRNIHTYTHTQTHVGEHFHPTGTSQANQYARKPQGLVSHCFQTRPNSSYRKIYCTAKGQAAIYFGTETKNLLPVSQLCATKNYTRGFWRASIVAGVSTMLSKYMKARVILWELLKVNLFNISKRLTHNCKYWEIRSYRWGLMLKLNQHLTCSI